MRRIIGAIIILTCLAILIHDTLSGRMSTFRDLFNEDDVNKQLAAALNGRDVEALRVPLWRGADPNFPISKRRNRSTRPLCVVMDKGRTDMAAILLAHGADADVELDWRGTTVLHYAAEKGDAHLARVAIASGATINATRKWRRVLTQDFPQNLIAICRNPC